MRKNYFSVFVMVIFLGMLLSGCATEKNNGAKTTAESEAFRIVTSFYPMYVTVLNITQGVEGVEVVNLTKPQTGCLHDYQLTPEDVKKLESAHVFVINGAGMESFLDKVMKQQPKLNVIEASSGITLLTDQNGTENPHVWVSITEAIKQVQTVARQLSALDEKHRVQYEKNAQVYIEKLTVLKDEMHSEIDSLEHKDIVTFHEAFPYFAEEFGLNVVAVVEREPGSEPSPKELEGLISKVRASGVKALFAEPQYPASAAEIIARETGAKVYTLDPVVVGEAAPGAINAYLDRMRENAAILKKALQP